MRTLGHILTGLLALGVVAQVLGFTYVLGALDGAERVRSDAVAEGYAVRERGADGHDVFRWKTTAEIERWARRTKQSKRHE